MTSGSTVHWKLQPAPARRGATTRSRAGVQGPEGEALVATAIPLSASQPFSGLWASATSVTVK